MENVTELVLQLKTGHMGSNQKLLTGFYKEPGETGFIKRTWKLSRYPNYFICGLCITSNNPKSANFLFFS